MKKFIFLFSLLACAVVVGAQGNAKPPIMPSCDVINADANHLYRYADHRCMISVPGFADTQISVKCTGAAAKKQGKFWIITPKDSLVKTVQIEVFGTINGEKVRCGSRIYRVIDAHPKAQVFDTKRNTALIEPGDFEPVKTTIKNLLQPTAVIAAEAPADLEASLNLNVVRFKVRFPDRKVYSCEGNTFPADVQDKIRQLHPGDVLIIHSVVAKCGNSADIQAEPLTIIINQQP